MRHNVSGRKLNRSPAHRRMLYRNLVTALFKHGRIETTVPKAKEARSVAERLITFAKRGDLHARRQAARRINEPEVLQKLFAEIGPRYADRPGGYTRILRLGPRRGDNAELAILELIDDEKRVKPTDTRKRKRARRVLAPLPAASADPVAPAEGLPTEDTAPAEEEAADVAPPEATGAEGPADEPEEDPKQGG